MMEFLRSYGVLLLIGVLFGVLVWIGRKGRVVSTPQGDAFDAPPPHRRNWGIDRTPPRHGDAADRRREATLLE